MNRDDILKFLKFVKNDNIEKIGLFGSYSRGDESLTSDIDIALKFKDDFLKKCDPWDYFKIIEEIREKVLKKFHIKVDIFDLDSISPYKKNISKEAIYV
jgi:predicted nucleotidyltransferase